MGNFYLTSHPMLFTRLLEVLDELVDHSRVVNQLRRTGDWALQIGQVYMKAVQKSNLSAVNEALNELYIEDEDYESLRKSIDKFQNFNMIALASKLATHELLEFRRISAYVYRCNKKWSQSIELSKNDRMFKDCIDTANESADEEIIENLLRFFCETSEKECFCATLYTCFAHVRPDVALELGWLNGYQHFIIQNMRQTYDRLNVLEDRTKPPPEEDNQDHIAGTYSQLGGFNTGMLMIGNGADPMMQQMPNGVGPQQTGIDMSGFAPGGPQNPGMPNQGMPMPAQGMTPPNPGMMGMGMM